MMHETLSQFIVDPETEESYDVIVPSNWLKKVMRDYNKLTLQHKETQEELKRVSAFFDYKNNEVQELKGKIALMEDLSTLTRLDVKA